MHALILTAGNVDPGCSERLCWPVRRAGARCSFGNVNVPPLLVAATTSYATNRALGAAVATGVVRTGRWHWIHHAMYT